MAALDITRTAFGSNRTVSSVSALINRLVALTVAWNDARVTRKALSTLTDRELEDIGLIRGDIDSVAQSNLIR